ncbi:tRNA-cytidine(32) 2-sulfurtransferase [Dirofilaria immitis]
MNQAIRQVAEDSFRDWKNKFPSPIAIKLQSIQNEVFLVIDTLLWFNRLKSASAFLSQRWLSESYRKNHALESYTKGDTRFVEF